MQWDTTNNAGFTTGTPWLPIAHNNATHNVASETSNPSSILNFYRRAIRLRRQSPALIDGDYRSINGHPAIFAYWRTTPRQAMLIALNMSAETQRLKLDNSGPSGAYSLRRVLDNVTIQQRSFGPHELALAPYEAAILEVQSR
jgi:glycosidase